LPGDDGGRLDSAREVFGQEEPAGDIIKPTFGSVNCVKVEEWKINRVFYYLSFTSVACLGTIIISPHAPVEATVAAIWTGSVTLSHYLLRAAYNGADVTKKA
jgi:hypothetical protein